MDNQQDERRWRQALRLLGRATVEEYLRTHPGQPGDPMFDLPLHPPFPSREFCKNWCAEEEFDLVKGYGTVILLGVLFVVIALSCTTCALSSFLDSAS
jgi:hypothetical protein